jgi:hypothetical protein
MEDMNNKIKKMTIEAIQKYPGNIEQLRNDWPGIIEDILEIAFYEYDQENGITMEHNEM